MKRFLSLFATGAASASMLLALGLTTTAMAQTRGFGAGGIVMDDSHGHTITEQTPQSPSAEWNAWQPAGGSNLNWFEPTPPVSGAQAGFVLSGPLTGAVVPELAYWLPPGQTTINGGTYTGGFAGAWDHATPAQLGIGGFTPAYLDVYAVSAAGNTSVAQGSPVNFDNFPKLVGFTETSSTTFTVTNAGTYIVEYTANMVTGGCGFGIEVSGVLAQGTAFGASTGTSIVSGMAILTLPAAATIQLINLTGSASAVSLAPPFSGADEASITAIRIE